MIKTWFTTYTGVKFDILNPRIEDINLIDIAHSLSMQCRYNGHVPKFYSIAEHCVFVSRVVPTQYQFAALLHDAGECYVGDIVNPLKMQLQNFRDIEDKIMTLIYEKYKVSVTPIMETIVKEADIRVFLNECKDIFSKARCDEMSSIFNMYPYEDIEIQNWSPEKAKIEFIERFHYLQAA